MWYNLLPEYEDELRMMYNQVNQEKEAKDYFVKKISMIMAQYKADSYYKNDTLSSFTNWLMSHDSELIRKIGRVFSKNELAEQWRKCTEETVLNSVCRELDAQGEKALNYLVRVRNCRNP